MRRVADYQGSGNIWKPVAPEGYVCLGDIFTKWGDPNKPTESAYINNNTRRIIKYGSVYGFYNLFCGSRRVRREEEERSRTILSIFFFNYYYYYDNFFI